MKPILTLASVPVVVLALASPARADWPIFLGHQEPEYAGFVDHWPSVVRTRQLAKLCPPQQFAIIERDKAALEARTRSIYGPAFGLARPAATTASPAPASPATPPETTPASPPSPFRPAPRDEAPRSDASVDAPRR